MMMSGPALKHVDSHSAIHEAALIEATELTKILDHLVTNNQLDKALEVAFVIVEHWETRTLQHAESEEEGLYKELEESSPELRDSIIALKRDHNLLRLLVKEIKTILDGKGVSDEVVQRLQALILVDLLHNQEEEKILPHH
ncbi:hemerythrin domain-containing protein [Virgibacillus necropolis]|uniref:hemerythrin domain-containing protein n=1 Tax=Virgibacillus necropolis TaxID=163877 RepID=UPI00384B5E16